MKDGLGGGRSAKTTSGGEKMADQGWIRQWISVDFPSHLAGVEKERSFPGDIRAIRRRQRHFMLTRWKRRRAHRRTFRRIGFAPPFSGRPVHSLFASSMAERLDLFVKIGRS
ncbi:hypothetical protein V6N12_055170 [Hibiscus sabdariffa]|uniref:Uncharacterized protein n=1 Tax=Hibiscus sabdariffa TaxID=183260 RepID=A0ABR2AME3_9ROSI